MNKILIKAMRPHRQKILTEQGDEKRLQQWANQKAAEQLRGAGGDASGEQFEQAREALMREAVMNPDKHGLKFLGERVPFEGQELMSDLSEPDPEGEMAAIDSQFASHPSIVGEPMDGEEKEGMLEHMKERGMGGSMVGKPPQTPDVESKMSSIDDEFRNPDGSFKYEIEPPIVTSPGNTFNTPPKTPDVFDEQGNLRSTLKPDEEEEAENTKTKRQHIPMSPDHPDYFKTSRQTAFRDAWSLLKSQ